VVARDRQGLLRPLPRREPAGSRLAIEYRRKVLEAGGSKPAAEIVRDFLGRDFAFDAYREWLERGREPAHAVPVGRRRDRVRRAIARNAADRVRSGVAG